MPSATVNSGAAETLVDARGLLCPLPALRLARAVRMSGPGRYRLLCDDPAARVDVPALARERGWMLLEAGPGQHLVVVPPGQAASR